LIRVKLTTKIAARL